MHHKVTSAKIILLLTLLTIFSTCAADTSQERVVYEIDFSSAPDGDAHDWMSQNSYITGLDAEELDMKFSKGQLVIETQDSIAGIVGLKLKEESWLHDVTHIEVKWGVSRQPKGANWESGNNSVPIALMFFFGTEDISSGLPFGINSAPYFISPFIGNHEQTNKMYLGKLYREGGRYICVATTEGSDDIIISKLSINPEYLTMFSKEKIPPITMIGMQMNTKDTEGGARAFINRIRFLSSRP